MTAYWLRLFADTATEDAGEEGCAKIVVVAEHAHTSAEMHKVLIWDILWAALMFEIRR